MWNPTSTPIPNTTTSTPTTTHIVPTTATPIPTIANVSGNDLNSKIVQKLKKAAELIFLCVWKIDFSVGKAVYRKK